VNTVDDDEEEPERDMTEVYRAINRKFVRAAAYTMFAYISIIVICFAVGMDPPQVLAVSTTIFQVGVIGWGLGFIGSYFVRMEKKTDLSIHLGVKTANAIPSRRRTNRLIDKGEGRQIVEGQTHRLAFRCGLQGVAFEFRFRGQGPLAGFPQ